MNESDESLQARVQRLAAENEALHAKLAAIDATARTNRERRRRWAFFSGKVAASAFAGSHLYLRTIEAWSAWRDWLRDRNGPWPEEATRNFTASLLARLTRLGLFAIVVAVIPLTLAICQTTILHKQNKIVDKQNELISIQNRFVEQQAVLMSDQNHLAEASRRAVVIFELANILDDIRAQVDKIDEMRAEGVSSDPPPGRKDAALSASPLARVLDPSFAPPPYKLSNRLANRIVSLSRALRPYRYYEYNEAGQAHLRPNPTSPERGQLLIALLESRVDISPFASRADFSYADLAGANIIHQDLTNVDLRRANLRGANFNGTSLSNANLGGADLTAAWLNGVKLCGAYLRSAILHDVQATDSADFSGAEVGEDWLEKFAPVLAKEWRIDRIGDDPDDKRRVLVLKTDASARMRKGDAIPRPCGTWASHGSQ